MEMAMRYSISAEDLLSLILLASHLDTEGDIGRILMRVSEEAMRGGGSQPETPSNDPIPTAKPE